MEMISHRDIVPTLRHQSTPPSEHCHGNQWKVSESPRERIERKDYREMGDRRGAVRRGKSDR